MRYLIRKNSIEKYAQIGKISHELFHDILNPLTGLMLYLDVLEKNKEQNITKQIEEVKNSSRSVRNFLNIIQNNLLNPNEKCLININKEINEIIKLVYYKAKKNRVSIIFINNFNQKIFFSKIEFYQLVINLLSNAIDSFNQTERNKNKIIIKIELIKNKIRLSVIDNGCGIKKENLKNIFKSGHTNKENGLGIGLRTVQKIVKNNKGKVFVKSLGENKGATFTILIPINNH